jgi:hypothetical protein
VSVVKYKRLCFRFPEITSLSTQFHSAALFCGIDPALWQRVDLKEPLVAASGLLILKFPALEKFQFGGFVHSRKIRLWIKIGSELRR